MYDEDNVDLEEQLYLQEVQEELDAEEAALEELEEDEEYDDDDEDYEEYDDDDEDYDEYDEKLKLYEYEIFSDRGRSAEEPPAQMMNSPGSTLKSLMSTS